jgi:ABC-type antimicrobial peptide transport system permease subunit
MVLRQGLLLTLAASAIGLAAATALTQFMASLLFNITPTDARTFMIVGGILALVAMAAALIPAIRAMKINPVTALRES